MIEHHALVPSNPVLFHTTFQDGQEGKASISAEVLAVGGRQHGESRVGEE